MRPVATTFDIKPEEKAHTPISDKFDSFVQDLKGGGAFPWKPTLKDKVRHWFTSQKLQLAAQVAVAQIWASMFTFVRRVFLSTDRLHSFCTLLESASCWQTLLLVFMNIINQNICYVHALAISIMTRTIVSNRCGNTSYQSSF